MKSDINQFHSFMDSLHKDKDLAPPCRLIQCIATLLSSIIHTGWLLMHGRNHWQDLVANCSGLHYVDMEDCLLRDPFVNEL